MNIYLPHNWAPIIKRQTRHRQVNGFALLTPDEARALVAYDAHLNGYDTFRRDSWLGSASFETAYDLDHPDLARAICIGIERNITIRPDDPLYAEKDMLRMIYAGVYGDLGQPFHVRVGRFGGTNYWPEAIRKTWLKVSK